MKAKLLAERPAKGAVFSIVRTGPYTLHHAGPAQIIDGPGIRIHLSDFDAGEIYCDRLNEAFHAGARQREVNSAIAAVNDAVRAERGLLTI